MKTDKMYMEYRDQSWCFVTPNGSQIKFEQAVVDSTYAQRGRVEGFVVSVHGVSDYDFSAMDARTAKAVGIRAPGSLGAATHNRGRTLVRLMPNGTIERV